MTTPARTQPGPLGSVTVAPAGTGELRDFEVRPGTTRVVLHLHVDQLGTIEVLRRGDDGTFRRHLPLISVTTTAEEQNVTIDRPAAGILRTRFTNAGGVDATFRGEATYGGQGSAGR